MAKFTDVTIDYANGKVTCDPMEARVYYAFAPGPDSVRWTVETFPQGADRVELRWEVEAPFRDFGMKLHQGKVVLLGTGNRGKEGSYKYTILFLDDAGNVLAGLDPMILNDPLPPN